MKIKKMGVLLIISLVMIMSVSAIAAADTNETLLEDVSDTDIVTTSLGYGGDNVTSYNDGGGVDDVDELKVNDKSDEISTKKEVKVTSSSNEGLLSASNDDENDILSDGPGNYSGLSSEIGSGGSYIGLQHDYYSYDGTDFT